MSGTTYYFINNKGQGNCMYLAYSISLMYALRHKNDETMTNNLFGMLELEEDDQQQLKQFLQDSQLERRFFNESELDAIQKILGPRLRAFAANAAILAHRQRHYASAICEVVNYAMLVAFKKAIPDIDINSYQPVSRVADMEDAELYRLPGFQEEVQIFYAKHKETFRNRYNERINDEDPNELSKEKKILIFDSLVLSLSYHSELINDDFLERYQSHLATNQEWGSIDSLLTMHLALTNEHMEGPEGARYFERDNDISLRIAHDGLIRSDAQISEESVDILLNNHHNIHWTSAIPEDLIPDIDDEIKKNHPTLELSPFSENATTSYENTTFDLNPDNNAIEQQRQLLEYYAKQKMVIKQTATPSELEEERKRLFYLSHMEGKPQIVIDQLLKDQNQIRLALEATKTELLDLENEINNEGMVTERMIKELDLSFESEELENQLVKQENLSIKQFYLNLEQTEKRLALKSNEESLMRLLAIAEAEKSQASDSSLHGKEIYIDKCKEPPSSTCENSADAPIHNLNTEDKPTLTASWMLEVLQSFTKNTVLMAIAILAGIGIGLLITSSGLGIPAAVGLGFATSSVVGSGLLSFFNRDNQEESHCTVPTPGT